MGWMEGVLVLGVLVTVVARVPEPAIIDSRHREEKAGLVLNAPSCGEGASEGTCLPYFLCNNLQGTVDGTCSAGFGQCCLFERSCGDGSDTLLSYFTNVDANANTVTSCDLSVTKIQNVCQLRLEMPLMTLAEPDSEGECVDQYLEVTGGQGGNSIKICGDNAGQHLVVNVKDAEGPFIVSVVNTVVTPSSTWRIKITQISCDSPDLAPVGCDQYYLEPTGSVKSFNYVNKESTATLDTPDGIKPGARHLQGSYTVCAKVETESCGLTWSSSPDDYSFTITGNPTLAPQFNIQINEDCLSPATDYLLFSVGESTESEEPIILVCGTRFPPDVSSSSDRFKVIANSVEAGDNDLDNRGFHLSYMQKAC
ncbi:hypothetical protein Pcinc_007676 [Petrolisthes cinctipes]|uniref:CUB domain-containing protein n=1 Tax=Petrolisthes cinctipes TaxID=88211 RepID=A0AAE1GET6_PETCI|nr:hypothetical protein Pcinc_007676 [Petrolisthes cinctipes]